MPRSTVVVLLLIASSAGAVCAQRAGNTPLAEAVLTVEDARLAAMIRADTAALAGMLADDLVYVHSSGRVETKAQFLTAVGSGSIRYLSFVPVERRVIEVGAAGAIIVGRSNVRVITGGQELVFEVRHIGVYSRVGDRWQLRAWQTTRVAPPTGG